MGQEVTKLVTAQEKDLIAAFEITTEQIAQLHSKFSGITFDTPANYEVGRLALGTLRGLRTKIEKVRVDAKAEVLERGRLIDRTAKTFSKLVEDIEDPLIAAKKAVDDAAAKAKLDAERAELIALEAEQTRLRLEAEAKARQEREEAEKRIAAERQALEAEKARQAAAQREIDAAQEAERQKLAAERQALDADRRRVDEAARKGREADEARAREAEAVRARAEAEAAAKAEAERLEAIRPEREKVHAFAAAIRALATGALRGPTFNVESDLCVSAMEWAFGRLRAVADKLDEFDAPSA